MKLRLFLDDEREPMTPGIWAVARNFNDAVAICVPIAPEYISFDHDLGDGPTGYDFAKWLVARDLDHCGFLPDGFEFNVHSANVAGRANIEGLLNGYLSHRAASAGETRSAETTGSARQGEHAVPEGETPNG